MARLITRQDAARLLNVSAQTISNWAEKGIIKGHMVGNNIMFDRNSIEQYFDDLQDLDLMEKTIAEEAEYLKEEDSKLKYEIKDILETRKGYNDAPNGAYRHIAEYAINNAYDMFTENQRKIIHHMTGFCSMEPQTIAEEMGMSRNRVVDIFFQSVRKMMETINLVRDRDNLGKLEAENQHLSLLTSSLMQELKDSKSRIAILEKKEQEPKSPDELMIEFLCTPVANFGFKIRSLNILGSMGCKTIGDVISIKKEDLMKVNKCGKSTIEDIENVLSKHDLSLDSDISLLLQIHNK